MATIKFKSYTDIEQSKKLAEILPIESADMLFQLGEDKYADSIRVPLTKEHWEQMMPDINPCWSLAVLLDFLPNSAFLERGSVTKLYRITLPIELVPFDWFVEPVDACYEMIIRLNELKML